jgi:hypothetical protein
MRKSMAVSAVLFALITGCASPQSGAVLLSPTVGSGSVPAACPSAEQLGSSGGAGIVAAPLPGDLAVTEVVECSVEDRPVAGDGVWSFNVEKRSIVGIERLLATLRTKDEPAPANLTCALVGITLPWFALVDTRGNWVRPHLPLTMCGAPQPAMMSALAAVSWSTVRATKDKQVTTQAQATAEAQAAAVGCATPFKDMISIDASFRVPTSSPSGLLGSPQTGFTVCHYAASKDPGGMPLLTFISGRRVSGTAAATLANALMAAGPVQPCQLAHTTVIGIFTSASDWLLIEDDGCHRVLDGGNNSWSQATPALLATLK